jgi:hypothetical protein
MLILDVTGNICNTLTLQGARAGIDISHLAAGIYFFRALASSGKVYIFKITKVS